MKGRYLFNMHLDPPDRIKLGQLANDLDLSFADLMRKLIRDAYRENLAQARALAYSAEFKPEDEDSL